MKTLIDRFKKACHFSNFGTSPGQGQMKFYRRNGAFRLAMFTQ